MSQIHVYLLNKFLKSIFKQTKPFFFIFILFWIIQYGDKKYLNTIVLIIFVFISDSN